MFSELFLVQASSNYQYLEIDFEILQISRVREFSAAETDPQHGLPKGKPTRLSADPRSGTDLPGETLSRDDRRGEFVSTGCASRLEDPSDGHGPPGDGPSGTPALLSLYRRVSKFHHAFDPDEAAERRRRILESSRRQYARSKQEVEKELRSRRTSPEEPKTQEARKAKKEKASKEERKLPAKKKESLPTKTLEGRGGEEHKYLQNLIRRWAQN